MNLKLILTNDWELYGEGSGDFYKVQGPRLAELLNVVEKHEARVTIFAEVGQQFAHLEAGKDLPHLKQIGKDWERSVRSAIQRNHDVQLHWHPTWEGAVFKDGRWNLNLTQWRLADPSREIALQRLVGGRIYLESLGRRERDSYRCVAFRAGAFCLQPFGETLPILREAGLLCDSSVLPGFWDYIHFNYRHVRSSTSRQWISEDGLHKQERRSKDRLLELPVHTESVVDSPILRKFLSHRFWRKLTTGSAPDETYRLWARERDKTLHELCDRTDPLSVERAKAKAHPRWWLSYFAKRSAQMLDTDFTSPQILTTFVQRAVDRAKAENKNELVLTLIGHVNNSHNFENLDRILMMLRERFGKSLSFTTVQEEVTRALNEPRSSARSGKRDQVLVLPSDLDC